MPRQTSIQLTDATERQVEQLQDRGFGTFTNIVRVAIDRMYQTERSRRMYHIDADKLEAVVRLFNEQVDPKATDDLVETEICADWHEGVDRQAWIDNARPQEIVDWLASFYE